MIRLTIHGVAIETDSVAEALALIGPATTDARPAPTQDQPFKALRSPAVTIVPPGPVTGQSSRVRPADRIITHPASPLPDVDRRVLSAIRAHQPAPRHDLITATGLKDTHLKVSLKRLRTDGRVVCVGLKRQARWSVVPGKDKAGDGFEVTWDGARERKGKAPRLAEMGRG